MKGINIIPLLILSLVGNALSDRTANKKGILGITNNEISSQGKISNEHKSNNEASNHRVSPVNKEDIEERARNTPRDLMLERK
jgi:hypothetical protein